MRKLSEIKGEEALDVLAEILLPIVEIAQDEEVKKGFETNVAKCVSVALKKHKNAIIDIFVAINGKPREETLDEIDLLALPSYMIDVLNEPAVQALFR